MSSKSSTTNGSKVAKSKSENPAERCLDSSDVKSSMTECTVFGETESEEKKSEVTSPLKTYSRKKTSTAGETESEEKSEVTGSPKTYSQKKNSIAGETESEEQKSEVTSSPKTYSRKKTSTTGETESEEYKFKVTSSLKTYSRKKISITADSHKDLRKHSKVTDFEYDKVNCEYFSDFNITCDRCKKFYSYKDNKPYIMKCGVSICEKCASFDEFNCKDCKSMEEKNFPMKIINKHLNQNNSLILHALTTVYNFIPSNKIIMNKKLCPRRLHEQKLNYQCDEVLRSQLTPRENDHDIIPVCKANFDMIKNCTDELKFLRSSIESFSYVRKLDDTKKINEKNETLQTLLPEVDSSFFFGFIRLLPSMNFQFITKLYDFKFSNRYLGLRGHIRLFSYSKKQKHYRVYFAGPYLLLNKNSESIGLTNRNNLIFDEESFRHQVLNRGIFFNIIAKGNLLNIPIRFGKSSIGKQISSFCSIDQKPSFVSGELLVGIKEIVIKARLNDDVKYWYDIDELTHKAPITNMVSLTQIEDLEVTLTIHLTDSDTPAYMIGTVNEYLPAPPVDDYDIVSFGVTYEVI